MTESSRGDRRPPRRDGDGRGQGGSAGPKPPRRGGKPHPSLTPRHRPGDGSTGTPQGVRGGAPDGRRGPGGREARPGDDLKPFRPKHVDPSIPDDVQPSDLPKDVRVELRTLTPENQEFVARHLVMAARLIDDDAALAHEHAISAARRGGRIGVVRETLGITAYAVGDFALALRELRTYRRITGRDDQLPLMVDSERGLGRPEKALELGRSVPRGTLPVPVQVELAIAMSGARLDLGQLEEALAELEIPQLDPDTAYSFSPGLFDAYATVLEDLGRADEAALWYRRADVAAAALQELAGGDDTIEIVEEDE